MKLGCNSFLLPALLSAALSLVFPQADALAQSSIGESPNIGVPLLNGGSGEATDLPEQDGLPFFDNSITAGVEGVGDGPAENPFLVSPADNPAAASDATGSSGTGVSDSFAPNVSQTFDDDDFDDDFDDDDFDDDDFDDDDDDDGPGVLGVPGGNADFAGDPQTDRRSLFGFFNTVVNDFNFLELVNLSRNTIQGEVILTDFEGREARRSFTIAPQRRTDIELHTIVGEDTFGYLIVTQNGRPGALVGNVTQYSTGDGGELTLVSTQPLERVFGQCR